MPTLQSQLLTRRHLVWLLWLVLLLPLAQTAATWHVLSHMNSQSAPESDSRQAIHHAQCDLCLGAAALAGGAPLVPKPVAPLLHALHEAPLIASHLVLWRLVTLAYYGRAPPSLPH